jgi:hypothetical protein
MEHDEDKPGFRVTDRRRFTEAGEPTNAADSPAAGGTSSDAPPRGPVSFSTFVLGVSTQALLHLGEIEDPLTGQLSRDLPAAQHVIDILGILREKTRNNLDQAEEQLLDSILYDLRMRYVAIVRAPKKEEA